MECFIEIKFPTGVQWLLDLLRHGVADLTGSNMPCQKEGESSKGGAGPNIRLVQPCI